MRKKQVVRIATVCFVLLAGTILLAQQTDNSEALTNDDVVKMVAAHMDANKVVQMIQSQPGNYSFAANDIEQLKQRGVPESVVAAMQAKASSALAGGATDSASAPLSQSTSAAGFASAAAAKKPGVYRVGVVMPTVEMGQGSQNPAIGETLRSLLARYLTGPSTEVIPIAALLPQQVEAEAQAKQCDFLVYDSLTYKKSGAGLGFLKNARSVLGMIPMVGGVAAAAGTIATVAGGAAQVGELSSAITAKSQITLMYHVSATGSPTPLLSNTLMQKAKSDGEDIITPLLEQEANAVMAQLTSKGKLEAPSGR